MIPFGDSACLPPELAARETRVIFEDKDGNIRERRTDPAHTAPGTGVHDSGDSQPVDVDERAGDGGTHEMYGSDES